MVQQHKSVYIEKYAQFCYSNIFPHTQTCTHTHRRTRLCMLISHLISYFLWYAPSTPSLLYKHIPAFCVTSNKISNFEQMALYRFASFLLYVCPTVPLSPSLSLCLSFRCSLCVCVWVSTSKQQTVNEHK